MDAVVLAAGLGTRLRPLTDALPKALVPVAGVPLLERVARRLVAAGADRLVVNVHPFAEQVAEFVAARRGFGVEVVLSFERDSPLETGGGLLAARGLLRARAPFFLHNVDVLSDVPLEALYAAHGAERALVTLAVAERDSPRRLLFDEDGLLGRVDEERGLALRMRPAHGEVRALAFTGIHVVSPAFLDQVTERGAFSILDPYLRLAAAGARILPFRADGRWWVDVGRPEHLTRAEAHLASPGR